MKHYFRHKLKIMDCSYFLFYIIYLYQRTSSRLLLTVKSNQIFLVYLIMVPHASSLLLLGFLSSISNVASMMGNDGSHGRREMPKVLCCPVAGQDWKPTTTELVEANIKALQSRNGNLYNLAPKSCMHQCLSGSILNICSEVSTDSIILWAF
jgi:hypothetical protein